MSQGSRFKIGLWLLDLVFPKECIHCGIPLDYRNRDYLCPSCYKFIFWIKEPICEKCGRPLSGTIIYPVECFSCREKTPAFHRARSIFTLQEVGQSFVLNYKYNQNTFLCHPAIRWLREFGQRHYRWSDYDLLLPVPLHPRKARDRGFNQSELLARGLSRLTGIPLARKKFVRARYTGTQTRLSPKERRENVRGAFRVKDKKYFWERNLLLLDDVYTTGATVNECARVLLKSGARQVDVLTLARAR